MMVGIITRRRQPKHARTPRAAHVAPGDATVPRKFWPVLLWRDGRARGLRTDPEHEDTIHSLGRDYDAWQRERRNG